MKMTLKLDLSGEVELVSKFERQIVALLEYGKNIGLVKYDMMSMHGDQVKTHYGDPDDDIREVVAEPVRLGRGARMAVRLTDVERAQIRKLKVDEHMSFRQISEATNISEQGVYRVLKQAGLTKPAPEKVSDEEHRRMMEMADSGISVADIAKQIGRNWTTVERYLEKHRPGKPKLTLVKKALA